MAGLRHSLYFTSLFVIHFFSEHIVSGAKNYKKNTGQGLSYANFVRDPFHYLNATKVGSSLVTKASACNLACVDNPSCVSFNVAAEPDIYGHLLCELLATDKYNSSDQFKENPDFHYYSVHVSSFRALTWRNFSLYIRHEDRCSSVYSVLLTVYFTRVL